MFHLSAYTPWLLLCSLTAACAVLIGSENEEQGEMRTDDVHFGTQQTELVRSSALQDDQCVHCRSYVAMSAQQKESVLMQKIQASEYAASKAARQGTRSGIDGWPHEWPGFMDVGHSLWNAAGNNSFAKTFDRFSDEYPEGRHKAIHMYGSVASIRWEKVDNNKGLTGLFNGANHGIIRFSQVSGPDRGSAPGLGFKLFRNGTYSSNIIAQANLGLGQLDANGNPDYNVFRDQMKTWVPTPSSQFSWIKGKAADITEIPFHQASAEPQRLDTEEFATGPPGSPVVKPDNVYFLPNVALKERFTGEMHEFRDDLASVPAGSLLYDVYVPEKHCLCEGYGGFGAAMACNNEPDCATSHRGPQPCADISKCSSVHIGKIFSTSPFIGSRYGDTGLFFQHQRWEKRPRTLCKGGNNPEAGGVYTMAGAEEVQCLTKNPTLRWLGVGVGHISGSTTPQEAPVCPAGSTPIGSADAGLTLDPQHFRINEK